MAAELVRSSLLPLLVYVSTTKNFASEEPNLTLLQKNGHDLTHNLLSLLLFVFCHEIANLDCALLLL